MFISIAQGQRRRDDGLNIEGLKRYLLITHGYRLDAAPQINRSGKPRYFGAAYEEVKQAIGEEIYFSVTHTGSITLTGYSCREIGMDAEYYRKLDYKPLLERYFRPEEADGINDAAAFLDLYTRKEAALKLSGRGIESLRGCSVKEPDVYFLKLDFLKNYFVTIAAGEPITNEEVVICSLH